MQLTEDQIRRIARQEGKKIVNGGSGMVIGGGSASGSSENAREVQHAKEADHAASADKATEADHAKEADHATKAAGLDDAAQTALDNKYLRKDQEDETEHKLTMGEAEVKGDAAVKGDLKIGMDGSYTITKDGIAKLAGVVAEYIKSSDFTPGTAMGFDGQGYGITKGTDGKYTLEIDNFIARMKMIVAEIEVHEMSFIGGTVVMSTCGNRVDRVEALDDKGICIADAYGTKPTLTIPDGKTAERFRCYFLASDGDRQIKNEWTVGQLARAKTNNIAEPGNYTNYQNRDYWRLVVGVSSAPKTIDGKDYHWIDLSNSTSGSIKLTDAAGTTWYYGYGGVSQTLNSLPFAGDNIIGMGHGWDDTRKNLAILSVDSLGWKLYKGIDHYDLPEENIVNQFSIDKTIVTTDHFILRPYAAPKETQTVAVVRGEYSDTASYGHNDMVTYEGQTWIASGVSIGETIKGKKPSATSIYWSLAAAKGIQGETPTFAKLRVDHSALHYNPTTQKWDYDSVTVTIVIFTPEGTRTPGNNDISEYYWLLDNDTNTKRASGWGFSKSLEVASHTATLYKVGSNVPLDTITVPMVRDGEKGATSTGAAATVFTIEPCANFEATGKLTDASHVTVSIKGDVQVYKTIGDQKTLCGSGDGVYAEYFRLSIGGTNYDGTGTFTYDGGNIKVSKNISYEVGKDKNNVPGSATITLYDLISGGTVGNQLASLVVPVSLNPGAIVDVNSDLGTIQNTTTSMQGTIETIKQGQGQISLKVQDLQNGGIDTGKPHTSSQVDFTTLSSSNFYPVMIKFKNDDGVRHTVMIDRPLNASYGSGKGYMTHPGDGFSFRLIFSDIANAWGSYEDGQLRVESISQRWTTPDDTPICPKIEQYNPHSFIVAWLRGGSKYDVTVDCTDAYISGIWPYMMQVASNPSWVPDAVRLASNTWTAEQVNAQSGNPYNLLQHDSGGFYADTDKEYLYRFGSLTAGHTFAIVGQPSDSKQWFIATWTITRISGSKVYVDVSSCRIEWQVQNPLGIRMNGKLGYIKTGASYAKSIWDSQSGFGTSESINNTAVHANWGASAILVIGTESGTGRDRAVLESVNSCSEGSSVSFFSGTYFDVSPLYGTDGRMNVKPDMLATGIDIKSHTIIATTDNFTVRNNSGETTFSIDANGNIVGAGNAHFRGTITGSTINGGTINGTTFTSSDGTSTTTIEGGKIKTNNINAKGGTISFFNFDNAGMYSGSIEQDGKMHSGLGMSMNNLSVSGTTNLRTTSVFLGSGWKDSRYTNSDNYSPNRVGSTYLTSTFYNYIKLERTGSGSYTSGNDAEHAALGIETQGDFCLAALGGPSRFAGMCLASNSGGTGDKQHTFYLCSGGTFTMPSNPPEGLLIVVIHTRSDITFNGNGKKFRFGNDIRGTAQSVNNGEWSLFYYDGSYWNAVMMNVNPW